MTDVFDTSRPESDVSPPLRTARRTARLCRSGHHRRHCHSPLCQHAAFATARCPPSHSVGTAASRQRMGGYGGPGGQGQGRAPIRSFSLGKASGQASAQRALRLSPITHVASGRDGPGREAALVAEAVEVEAPAVDLARDERSYERFSFRVFSVPYLTSRRGCGGRSLRSRPGGPQPYGPKKLYK